MENTIENKQKYFAAHWGQSVLTYQKENVTSHSNFCSHFKAWQIVDGYLELTPLSQISDEDAIEVCKIRWQTLRGETHSYRVGSVSEGKRIVRNIKTSSVNNYIVLQIFDFLRSKGYALPFMGLSVEKQIEYGWIKLKTE